jgi:hypothetical protein
MDFGHLSGIFCAPAEALSPRALTLPLLLSDPLADPPPEGSPPQAASTEAPATLTPKAPPRPMNFSRENNILRNRLRDDPVSVL